MRTILKWIGIIIGGIVAVIAVVVAATYIIAGERINKNYEITPEAVTIPEEISSNRDEWPLMLIDFCQECHGPALSGKILDDDPLFGTLISANITPGKGGAGQEYTDADFVRALRHGVDSDGRPLVIMPSQTLGKLSDKDLGEVIAFVKNTPPVDNELAATRLGPLGRLFFVFGLIPEFLPAEVIDHDAPREPAPEPGPTAAYGRYLSFMCTVCHTEDLSGGPDAGEGMNLTPGGQLANWTEEEFAKTIRTGVAPDGEQLEEEEMPWQTLGKFSDMEIRAIWLYLKSIPAIETEHR